MDVNERLFEAARRGDVDGIEAAIRDGAEVNAKDWGCDGETPLHLAAEHGHAEAVNALLAAEADVNSTSHVGLTPLHEAAWEGHAEVMAMLLAAGADTNVKDGYDNTPLHLASLRGHDKAVKVLLTAGAKDNVKNRDGQTPHELASRRGYTEIAAILEASRQDARKSLTVSKVIDIESFRKSPHWSGPAFCLSCSHNWVAVIPVGGKIPFECPSCGRMTGRYKFEFQPAGHIWECACGNQLFHLLPTSELFCPSCGSTFELRSK